MMIFPCPFCGGTQIQGILHAEWLDDTTAAVSCSRCKASGPCADTPEEAAELWNRATLRWGE